MDSLVMMTLENVNLVMKIVRPVLDLPLLVYILAQKDLFDSTANGI